MSVLIIWPFPFREVLPLGAKPFEVGLRLAGNDDRDSYSRICECLWLASTDWSG